MDLVGRFRAVRRQEVGPRLAWRRFSVAVQTAVCPATKAVPGQTQGFLLSVSPRGRAQSGLQPPLVRAAWAVELYGS